MNRLSLDCDCEEDSREPEIHDIGILASFDPVALDQACMDLIYQADGSENFIAQIERLNAPRTLEHGEEIGLGSRTCRLSPLYVRDDPDCRLFFPERYQG